MLQFPDHMRPKKQGEVDAVDALLREASDDASEARLVQQLRRNRWRHARHGRHDVSTAHPRRGSQY